MNWRKRLFPPLLCLLILLSVLPCRAAAVSTSAVSAVLMDADSGRLLYDKNGEKRMLIASTTKLMTALVALEQGGLQQEITVTGGHMAEGSSMYLRPGEKLTLETLLYGLLLSSGNDAALALASSLCLRMDDLGCVALRTTLSSLLNGLKRYDAVFFAHHVPGDIDYQLCMPVSESLMGVDYALCYLQRLELEDELLTCFPIHRVLALLESLCQLDLYKVEIYAETLLEIHGGIDKATEEA